MIGALRQSVTLLAPVRVPDAGGGYQLQFEERAEISARRTDRASRRRQFLGQIEYTRRAQFTIRKRDDILFEHRLRHEGKEFRITDLREDEAGRFQLIDVEEMR